MIAFYICAGICASLAAMTPFVMRRMAKDTFGALGELQRRHPGERLVTHGFRSPTFYAPADYTARTRWQRFKDWF